MSTKRVRHLHYLLAAATSVTLGLSATASAQDMDGWTVSSAAKGLQVTGVKQSGTQFAFDATNISGKPIVSVVVILPHKGGSARHGYDYFSVEPIAPGSAFPLDIGAWNFPAEGASVQIAAVAYADGTAEGSPRQIALIRAKWLGTALETARLQSVLAQSGSLSSLSNADLEDINTRIGRKLPATFEEALASVKDVRLKAGLEASTASMDKDARMEFYHGLCETRQFALGGLRQLEDKAPVPGAGPGGSGATSDRTVILKALRTDLDRVAERQQTVLRLTRGGTRE